MKKLLWMFLLLVFACQEEPKNVEDIENSAMNLRMKEVSSESLIEGIEHKIYNAFVGSYQAENPKPLNHLLTEMEALEDKEPNLPLNYWKSYLKFYAAIYYLEMGDLKLSEKEIEVGIEWMDEQDSKSSEDYALLAMLQSFSLQFKGMKAMFLAPKVKKNAEIALEMDPQNLRAYYVLGGNDFYTPEKYGGGKEAEKYLLKAIELPVQQHSSPNLPSWGKEESYELLVRLYKRNGELEKAKKYKEEALAIYPQSYLLERVSLENK